MKIATILSTAVLIILPAIGLTQTTNTQISPIQKETSVATTPTSAESLSSKKCGVDAFKVGDECGTGVYKNAYIRCYDGYEPAIGDASSCKPSELWNQYAKELCANHCSISYTTPATPATPATPTTPGVSPATPATPAIPAKPITAPQTRAESVSPKKCGVDAFKVYNECDTGSCTETSIFNNECGGIRYKNAYIRCYDGYEPTIGDTSSCKSSELWGQYAKEACANHCSIASTTPAMPATPTTTSTTPGGNTGGGGEGSVLISPKPATSYISPVASTLPTTSPQIKCGVNASGVFNECGAGVYKNAHAQCYDGFEINLGETTSCKPTELWYQYIKEACVNHCSTGNGSGVITKPLPQPTTSTPVIYAQGDTGDGNKSTPLAPLTPMPALKWISVCSISDNLMQNYHELINELQKQTAKSDKIKTEALTRELGNLKKYIEAQKKACADNPQTAWQVAAPPTVTENKSVATAEGKPIENKSATTTQSSLPRAIANNPVVIPMDRCNEVAQWENKIAYYKKLSNLGTEDLKKEGFSREEIAKILQELILGIEKVRAQCANQKKASVTPKITATTGQAFIEETVKPIVVESGQEINAYYKARIEKAVSTKENEEQLSELKTLRNEIDGLISNLIKSRKELEVSELNTLVKEVKVSRGEIKADDIVVKTIEKKMLVNIGDRPVSVEPTMNQVLIKDKGLEVKTDEVMIKENVLSVGGVDVKMSASEVTEKLNLVPKTIELKEDNAKAVYSMKINEQRKLFGFILLNSQRTITADAENGNILTDRHSWYRFLTTE